MTGVWVSLNDVKWFMAVMDAVLSGTCPYQKIVQDFAVMYAATYPDVALIALALIESRSNMHLIQYKLL
jgi:hypothetical protein